MWHVVDEHGLIVDGWKDCSCSTLDGCRTRVMDKMFPGDEEHYSEEEFDRFLSSMKMSISKMS